MKRNSLNIATLKLGKLWLAAVIVCLATVAVYLPSLGNNFVNWDDPEYVYDNPEMKAPGSDFVVWAFSTFRTGNWHPLTWLSLRADYAFWGLDPRGYHLTGILLHAFNTLLVTLLTGLLFMKALTVQQNRLLFAASAVGMIFGFHPLHVESVVWVSERKDVLYACLSLSSIFAYIGYVSSPLIKRRIFYFLCFLTFFLSLMSKPMAITLPAVLLILDFYPLRRLNLKSDFIRVAILEKLPFYVVSLAVSLVTIIAQKERGAMEAMEHLSVWQRLSGAIKAIGFYLAKTVWPVNLVPFYPLDMKNPLTSWEFILSVLLVLGITLFSLMVRRRTPLFIAAWSYLIITLLPVLGILQVGLQSKADRYMYLPILGLLMIIGALSLRVWNKGNMVRFLSLALFLSLSFMMAALTIKQTLLWKDSVSLWEYVISRQHDAVPAHYNLGDAYRSEGRLDKAMLHYQTVIRLKPDLKILTSAQNKLGDIYYDIGSMDKAIEQYQLALALDPDNINSHNNLATAYAEMGLTDKAIEHLLIALKLEPRDANIHYNLGLIFMDKGFIDKAIEHFERAIKLNPADPYFRSNLYKAYEMKSLLGKIKHGTSSSNKR